MNPADLSTPFVKATDGLVHIADMNLNHDTLYEAVRAWFEHDAEREEHRDNNRPDAEERAKHRAQAAADDVRNVAGFKLTPDMARVMASRLLREADRAEHGDPVRLTNPILRKA